MNNEIANVSNIVDKITDAVPKALRICKNDTMLCLCITVIVMYGLKRYYDLQEIKAVA